MKWKDRQNVPIVYLIYEKHTYSMNGLAVFRTSSDSHR